MRCGLPQMAQIHTDATLSSTPNAFNMTRLVYNDTTIIKSIRKLRIKVFLAIRLLYDVWVDIYFFFSIIFSHFFHSPKLYHPQPPANEKNLSNDPPGEATFWVRLICPTCPSPAGGSLTHSQAIALSKRARDVTIPLCYYSKTYPSFLTLKEGSTFLAKPLFPQKREEDVAGYAIASARVQVSSAKPVPARGCRREFNAIDLRVFVG